MKRRKHVLSVLGVSVLALMGMMAVSAVSAQAQTHLWLVGGVNWSANTAIDALDEAGNLLYLGVKIKCHANASGALPTASTATATIVFTKCFVEGAPQCKVHNAAGALDTVTASTTATLVLLDVVKFSPTGAAFTTIGFKRTELEVECLLLPAGVKSELLSVTGSVCAKVVSDTLVASKTVTEENKTNHGCALKVGNNPAQLDATVLVLSTGGSPITAH